MTLVGIDLIVVVSVSLADILDCSARTEVYRSVMNILA
jgi:hypothetical protein